jgi:alpha-amylase
MYTVPEVANDHDESDCPGNRQLGQFRGDRPDGPDGVEDPLCTVPTRFGSRERLQRCVAIMRANGLDVYVDTVAHQRSGGDNFVYRYRGTDGSHGTGRFRKDPLCSVPNVPRDPVAGPVADDFPFGDELCPVNARPPGYVIKGLTDAGDWMTRALDVQGYRIDDVKGLAVAFARHWLTAKSMATRFAVGEYFDDNPQTLNWWVWNSGMDGRCADPREPGAGSRRSSRARRSSTSPR